MMMLFFGGLATIYIVSHVVLYFLFTSAAEDNDEI